MKKTISGLIIALALCLAGPACAAEGQTAANPVEQFTGKYWVESTEQNKEAYLFGIESAVAVEYFISTHPAAKSGKTGKKAGFTLSPFEKGWMTAFKDTTRKQIASEVDKWYAEHPDQLNRPVLEVIWYELIEPRLAASK